MFIVVALFVATGLPRCPFYLVFGPRFAGGLESGRFPKVTLESERVNRVAYRARVPWLALASTIQGWGEVSY